MPQRSSSGVGDGKKGALLPRIFTVLVAIASIASLLWWGLPSAFGYEETELRDGEIYWVKHVTFDGEGSKSWVQEASIELKGVTFLLRLAGSTAPLFIIGTVTSYALRVLASVPANPNELVLVYEGASDSTHVQEAAAFVEKCGCGMEWDGELSLKVYAHPIDVVVGNGP